MASYLSIATTACFCTNSRVANSCRFATNAKAACSDAMAARSSGIGSVVTAPCRRSATARRRVISSGQAKSARWKSAGQLRWIYRKRTRIAVDNALQFLHEARSLRTQRVGARAQVPFLRRRLREVEFFLPCCSGGLQLVERNRLGGGSHCAQVPGKQSFHKRPMCQ